MSKKVYQTIKHVLEVRFVKKNFSFLDIKGRMLDYLLDGTEFEGVKVSKGGSRIDIVSKDIDEVFFFSMENFGLQIEGASNFEVFTQKVNQLFQLLEGFDEYKIGEIARVGTKSSIFYHKAGMSIEGIKQKYMNKMVNSSNDFEKITGSKIIDSAFTFLDLEKKQGKSHITTGPASRDEVIGRFFGPNKKYFEFEKQNGVYFEIDYYQEKNEVQTDLKTQIISNILEIERLFNNFVEYLTGEDEK